MTACTTKPISQIRRDVEKARASGDIEALRAAIEALAEAEADLDEDFAAPAFSKHAHGRHSENE